MFLVINFLILSLTYSGQSFLVRSLAPKIIGGFKVSSINDFKHQVSIRIASHESSRFGSGHICGGSLIDYDTVLTAAHCVHDDKRYLDPSIYVVVMGNLDLTEQNSNTVVREVVKIIGHAKYDPNTAENDIAILKLNSEVPKNHPTVEPIPLSKRPGRAGQLCQASGWGTTEYTEEARAVESLMAVNLTIHSRSKCNRPLSNFGSVTSGQFCAGDFNGGFDTCQGDSGGPLTCSGILVGITSHSRRGCGLKNDPGIYTDVAYYRNWIASATNSIASFLTKSLFYCLLVVPFLLF